MTDEKDKLRVLPTAMDELQASMEAVKRILPGLVTIADELAATRWAMYQAHLKAGFDEKQALELIKSMQL